jgi:hypothetical protein
MKLQKVLFAIRDYIAVNAPEFQGRVYAKKPSAGPWNEVPLPYARITSSSSRVPEKRYTDVYYVLMTLDVYSNTVESLQTLVESIIGLFEHQCITLDCAIIMAELLGSDYLGYVDVYNAYQSSISFDIFVLERSEKP